MNLRIAHRVEECARTRIPFRITWVWAIVWAFCYRWWLWYCSYQALWIRRSGVTRRSRGKPARGLLVWWTTWDRSGWWRGWGRIPGLASPARGAGYRLVRHTRQGKLRVCLWCASYFGKKVRFLKIVIVIVIFKERRFRQNVNYFGK